MDQQYTGMLFLGVRKLTRQLYVISNIVRSQRTSPPRCLC